MLRLYELQDQLVAIDNILADNTDPETEEILASAKNQILEQIDGKIENILSYINDCQTRAAQLREEAARLSKKRGSLDKKVEYLKNLICSVMKSNDVKRAEYGTYTVSVAKTPGRVVLDACDDAFLTKYKRISWDIDKTLLKQDMVNGKLIVDGKQLAHLEEGESIRIR